ncbi:MAG: Gfo/Idh/MocA family protein [Clostridia bacterium]|jgi:1,5-anhydro-D-fructose reductase (1,5-anhydro-D-mannitol-forming)
MLRVAMLSGWHVHAKGYARELNAIENVKVTAVWDEEPERGQQWAAELGVDFEKDLDTLLKRQDIDAVAVNTPTSMHKEVIIAAANAGKHIFTEKVLAFTVKDCHEIAEAVQKTGVKFCISFPHRTLSHNLFAKKVAEEGLIGDITLLRVRNAHDGASSDWLPDHFYDPETCGGGAMMDLGAHVMYLSRWILGEPVRITSMFNSYTGRAVEDNAVSMIEFKNKAIAIAETGFVSTRSPYSLELYGTEGSLFVGGPENQIKLTSNKIKGPVDGWITPTQLPKALPSALEQWVKGILEGGEIHFGLEEATQLTELMEAAYISYREGRMVDFKEIR